MMPLLNFCLPDNRDDRQEQRDIKEFPSKILVIGLGQWALVAAVSCVRSGISTTGFDLNPDALERFESAEEHNKNHSTR